MPRLTYAVRRARRDRGAAAVELALILPVLLLLIAGIIDLGRAYQAQMTVTQAAREGARMVALHYSASQTQTRVAQAAPGLPVTTTINLSCPATPSGTDASRVTVSTEFEYLLLDGIVNLFGAGIAPTATFSSQGSMRCSG